MIGFHSSWHTHMEVYLLYALNVDERVSFLWLILCVHAIVVADVKMA